MSDDLNQLVEKFIHAELSEAETAALNEMLNESRAARDEFRAILAIHGGLDELFSDDVEIPFIAEKPKAAGKTWLPFALAAALVGGFFLVLHSSAPSKNNGFARIVGGSAPEWSTQMPRRFGQGRYVLISGLAEIKVGPGARVAIEGPADFELFGPMRMKLYDGRLSAAVSPESVGFVVETPDGKVVDLGTQFGVSVSKTKGTEAHVFDGEIDVVNASNSVRLRENGGVSVAELSPIGSDPSQFPMPGMVLKSSWVEGFEAGTPVTAGMPTGTGRWSGDLCELVAADGAGIMPFEGESSLGFLKTNAPSVPGSDGTQASELWQLIDLKGFPGSVNNGEVSVVVSAHFNRLSGASSHQSNLAVMAFQGEMSDAPAMWKRKRDLNSEHLSGGSANVVTDSDQSTWEPLEVKMAVPPGTDFLLVSLSILKRDEGGVDGHFVDGVDLRLTSRARKSRPRSLWVGEGDVHDSSNWEGGEFPDLEIDSIDIEGGREAVLSRRLETKQTLVIGTGINSEGRLRIGKTGELFKSGYGEIIIGFNLGAIGEMVVEGKVKTKTRLFIGRNNLQSALIIDGGEWDAGDGMVRMAQYNSEVDTVSRLVIRNGGKMTAGSFSMVNDISTVELESGLLDVGRLWVGGDNGSAEIRLQGGELRVDKLHIESARGKIVFQSADSSVVLEGEMNLEEVLAIADRGWLVNQDPAAASNLKVTHSNGETRVTMR